VLRRFLRVERASLQAAERMTFGQAADAYLTSPEAKIRARSFRASTLRTYRNIIGADLRPR